MPVNEKDFHHVRLEKENAVGLEPIAKANRHSVVQETNAAVEEHIRRHNRRGDDRAGNSKQRRNLRRKVK